MKGKLCAVLITLIMVVSMFGLNSLHFEGNVDRIHQHQIAQTADNWPITSDVLTSHLPLVVIETSGQTMPGRPSEAVDYFGQAIFTLAEDGSKTIMAQLGIIDHQNAPNVLTDRPTLSTSTEIRVRGNSSRSFPKSSYQLRFCNETLENNNLPVMGMTAHHEWVLYGPYLDRTLIRNYLWYNIAGEIMEYAPNVRFCEVVLDGDYKGLYLMTESITEGKEGRLPLSEQKKNTETIGYLLRMGRPEEEVFNSLSDIYTYSERMNWFPQDISIVYPGTKNLTPEIAENIELDVSAFEKALNSFDYNHLIYGYFNRIDVNNFIEYFIINEFSGNTDAGLYSTYLYKEPGGKFKLCVWDFNNSCDNFLEQATSTDKFSMMNGILFLMLTKDEYFIQEVMKKYEALRQTVLSDVYLDTYIDETLAYLGPAIARNNDRWQSFYEAKDSYPDLERFALNHEEAVQKMKEWLRGRGEWMDENIHVLQQYSHPSRNKKFNH